MFCKEELTVTYVLFTEHDEFSYCNTSLSAPHYRTWWICKLYIRHCQLLITEHGEFANCTYVIVSSSLQSMVNFHIVHTSLSAPHYRTWWIFILYIRHCQLLITEHGEFHIVHTLLSAPHYRAWWIFILYICHCQLLITEHSDQSFSVISLIFNSEFLCVTFEDMLVRV